MTMRAFVLNAAATLVPGATRRTSGKDKRPIWVKLDSVNHSAPSGPAVMPEGTVSTVGIGIR
jgi:hypothetical protein